jgi:hypothetical protein
MKRSITTANDIGGRSRQMPQGLQKLKLSLTKRKSDS